VFEQALHFIFKFTSEYYFLILTTLAFILVYLSVKIKISNQKNQTLLRLKKRIISDPVETDSPVNNQIKNLKEFGTQGLESRFDFIEKALPFVLAILWFIVINLSYITSLPPAYVSVVAAVLSVMVGFALRPFLENLFSGIVISFFKSVKVGDTVIIDDHYGLIEEIGLTHSTLKVWDWNRLVIPNTSLLQKDIQNLTKNDTYLWAHVEFFVAPDTNLEDVKKIAIQAAMDSNYNTRTEEPSFWVMNLEQEAIKCWIAAWANTPGDAWELRADMRRNIQDNLRIKGIKTHSKFYFKQNHSS